ncbi:T3SS (YopN, CesT) and YbjN peptide-binding chaperone 1 [Ereboglobus luteus]|uniref:TY-Chap central domain-containing protein n=1 Tax=Ereboglobus luteus TaxID=1796921 RepID=A0A2U8E0X3_9BACT|nr:hypothetical protein [Ereboglobus luteus]AWI08499.1 hypothetical protein CKA38_03855 [Ereboglobus luteus]
MSSQTPHRRTREELQKLYMDALEQQGYRPELDQDGDVRFRHEGNSYFIEVREDDPMFFRVVMPNFWDIESPKERARIIEAANITCSDIKVAKVFIVRNDTWCAVELFLPEQELFAPILQRCLIAIRAAVNTFTEHMRSQPKPPPLPGADDDDDDDDFS